MNLRYADTAVLRIAYRAEGPEQGAPILLLHDWPDDAHAFEHIAPRPHEVGYRTITPWLRGFGPTRFRDKHGFRSGQIAAKVQDALDLADLLNLERFAVVAHDWGARIAYLLAAVLPERLTHCLALSVGWEPGERATSPHAQARSYWYQRQMATVRGADFVRKEGKIFARFHWDTWSPPGWFDDVTFDRTAASFANPDWAEITVHSYRVRWGEAEPDPRYAVLEARQKAVHTISVPRLMIQGSEDHCLLPESSAGTKGHFAGSYTRRIPAGVGHLSTREDPKSVIDLLIKFFAEYSGVQTKLE